MMKFTEALKLSNKEDIISSILIGQVGEKVPQELKDYAKTPEIEADINAYLKMAEDNNLDKTKLMQFAIKVACHSENPVESFNRWSSRELIPSLVKYSSADWLKNNESYKALSEKGKKLSLHDLENLRGFIRTESVKHGQSTKGSGKKQDNGVELLYKDSNWILLSPKSHAAEKKIAYFTNPKGEKEKCHWCTAAESNTWYNTYTYNNTKPLYVMINKDDKAWQLAYYPSKHRVEFLDSYDHKDTFTNGGWVKELPREMMAKVVNEFNGLSLLDYVDRNENKNSAESFEVKFLPWVKIIGEPSKADDDFDKFMLNETSTNDGLDLYISIRPRPDVKDRIRFKLSPNGPEILDRIKLKTFTKLEAKFLKVALLQYAAESLELDIDYMDKFNSLLEELKNA